MSELNEINYGPLLVMNGAWRTVVRNTLPLWGPGFIAVFVAISLLAPSALAFEAVIVLSILYSAVIGTKTRRLKNGMWWQFAVANNWALDTETPPGVIIPPSLQFGHSMVWSPIIKAQVGALSCDLLSYSCITGYGRSEQMHSFTLASVPLPQTLPHMLLLNKKSRIGVQRDLAAGETLKLEGDFDNFFSLQIEKGDEVNVLTVITPDVMQTLLTYNQGEDIEILGDRLYFIVSSDRRDARDMQLIIRSVAELGQRIVQNVGLAAHA